MPKKEIRINPPKKGGQPVIISPNADGQEKSSAWYQLCRQHYDMLNGEMPEVKDSLRSLMESRPDLFAMFAPIWLEDSMGANLGRIKATRRSTTLRNITKGKYEPSKPEGTVESEANSGPKKLSETVIESDRHIDSEWTPPKNTGKGVRKVAARNRGEIFTDLKIPYINKDFGEITLQDLRLAKSRGITAIGTHQDNVQLIDAITKAMENAGAKNSDRCDEILTEAEAVKLVKRYANKH